MKKPRTHRTAGNVAVAPPPATANTRISNRRLLELATASGARVVKTSGEWTKLRLPDGTTETVRAAHTGGGNPPHQITRIARAIGEQYFWNGVPAPAVEEPAPELRIVDAEPDPAPTAQPAEHVKTTGAQTRAVRRGIATDVLADLITAAAPQTVDQIAQRLSAKHGDCRDSVAGACAYLAKRDLARRIKPSVYAAVVAKAPDATVAIDITTNPPTPQAVTAPPAAPTPAAVPVVSPPPAPAVDEVLDVLFPNGLVVTAETLRLIDSWRALTNELLAKVAAA